MNLRRINSAVILYAAAFVLAAVLRMINLGSNPLNSGEAELALQAMSIADGHSLLIGPHPAYLALTSGLMFLFDDSNFAARFFPALAGSLLVLVPALFHRRSGMLPAVLLAFCLAVDPVLIGGSRQAGSLSLALFFILLSFGMWINQRWLMAGAAIGMALLSGPGIWPGVAVLLLACWIYTRIASKWMSGELDGIGVEPWSTPVYARPALYAAVLAAAAALFIAGTSFFTAPNGISAAAESLPVYLLGWAQPAGMPVRLWLISLLVYQLPPLIFAMWGAVNGLRRRDPVNIFLLVWWAAAFLLTIAYPLRSGLDLAWPALPMWALAARQIANIIREPLNDRVPVIANAALTGIILSYIALTLVTITNNPAGAGQAVLLRLIGALVMLFASLGLIAWGWSRIVALRGFLLGFAIVLLTFTLSASWDAAGYSGQPGREIWSADAPPSSVRLLYQTIDDLNRWGPRESGGLEIVVVETPSTALRWLLRKYERVTFVDQIMPDEDPTLVITPAATELGMAATYRGQGFFLSENIVWDALTPADWFRWAIFRTVPAAAIVQSRPVLWARVDLFPADEIQDVPLLSPQSAPVEPPDTDLDIVR